MKRAKLLHNPIAGDEEHTKKELISLIKSNGFECSYASVKDKEWKQFDGDVDFIIAAGGDGTVRKITKELLARNVLDKSWPLALLPLGTANNIAKTLGIIGSTEEIIQSWQKGKLKKYDVGRIEGIPESNFFLEGLGFGIFPYLIREIDKTGEKADVQTALEVLHRIIVSYEPRFCKLTVDDTDHSGKFLLAEVMNTRSIGPNLTLSPHANPGDGEFEVVLVPENHKEKFSAFVESRLKGEEVTYQFNTLKAKRVNISWEGTHVHVDDKVVKMGKADKVRIELKAGVLEFLVPDNGGHSGNGNHSRII